MLVITFSFVNKLAKDLLLEQKGLSTFDTLQVVKSNIQGWHASYLRGEITQEISIQNSINEIEKFLKKTESESKHKYVVLIFNLQNSDLTIC